MYKGLFNTQKGLSEADARIIGAMTARLVGTWDQWVHRRVERVTFCDADAVHRDVSADFTLPHWFHNRRGTPSSSSWPGALLPGLAKAQEPAAIAKRQLVPIGFLRKAVLVNFSLRDESDDSLPLLNSAQSAQVAEAMMISIAGRALERPVPHEIRYDIRALVRADHSGAKRPSEAEIAHDRLLTHRDKALAERVLLSETVPFASMAETFVEHFLALSMLDIYRHQRRVIHLSYEEPLHEAVGGGIRKVFPYVQRLASGEPRVMVFGSPAAGQAQSYHLEVESPEGHMISSRESYVYDVGNPVPLPARHTGTYRRAHFHFSHLRPGFKAAALVSLLPRPYTIVRGATGTCLLALAGIIVVTLRLGEMQGNNGEIATTILLTFAGLMSLFMVRSGEHEMATSMLFPLRTLVAAPVGLSFLAAIVVLAQPDLTVARITLGACAALTAVILALLVRNWWTVSKALRSYRTIAS